ncbi:unnamed protein product [Eruca vesicaria subsp. sativa]|uniref:Uncharacterized protein n=1 Tax=Eruca vesicaria subsp. sativa TaxID=29727 RepID=A0ABC8M9K3_ERUVS|nr:unnamed protein product [Eruca vesicaria subsp. sativa]
MSLILRFRRHLPMRSPLVSLIGDRRSFGKPASQSDEKEAIDQRKLPTDYDPARFYPTEQRSPPTERVFRLVDEISSLTLSEASDLGAILMRKKGVTVIPNVAVTMVQGQSVGVSE